MLSLLQTGVCADAGTGSRLVMDGGRLHADGRVAIEQVAIGPAATLSGSGVIQGTVVSQGTLSPGAGASDAATLTCDGTLTCADAARFVCHAESHTALDRLVVTGRAAGACRVELTRAVGAIPVDAVIVQGAAGSDYSRFVAGGAEPQRWQLTADTTGRLLATDRQGDTDADALPDWWELRYFVSRTAGNAADDTDRDVMLNLAEYRAGTDPRSAASRLAFVYAALTPDGAGRLAWNSASNRSYRLMARDDTGAGFTIALATNQAATPPRNVYTFTNRATARIRHYRVELEAGTAY